MSAKWLVMAQGKFEHNQELQLDRRDAVLAGPGYDVFQTNYAQIMLAGGMSYTHERYLDETIVDNAEGAAGFRADFFKLYTPKVDSTTVFFVLPNITTSGRVRMEFNSKLRVEVFKNFYINLTFYDSFDSDPPSATASKNDYGFVTGISFTFRR